MKKQISNPLYEKRWLALAVLCTAQFMVIMDTSIIGVALPAIQQSLNYSPNNLQWIFNAYVIVFGGVLILGGKLSDLYGPKRIFMWGFTILTIASIFTGLSWSELTMNVGRSLQGLGAALIAPSALTILMATFTDPKELNKAFGFWGASAAIGGSAGVFLGGLLTEYLSWRWTFYINVPIGIIVMLAGAKLLSKGSTQKNRIDYISGALITAAITVLVYTLVTVDQHGWLSNTTAILFAIFVVLMAAFIIIQKRSSNPLLPLSIFKVKNISSANIIMMLMAGAWIPLWFYLNLYLQQTLDYSAFYSGLALLPMTIAIMILMIGVTGRLIIRFGFKSVLIAGLICLTFSLLWFTVVPVEGTFLSNVLGASLLGAVGMSLAYIPGTIASVSNAKPEESGLASGLVNTTYQLGSAIGLAIAVVIAVSTTAHATSTGIADKEALTEGFRQAFKIAAIISALSIPVAIFGIKK